MPVTSDRSYLRLAEYYLKQLEYWNNLYSKGGKNIKLSLRQYDDKIEQLLNVKRWLDKRFKDKKRVAELCSDFPRAGAYLFRLRLSPQQNIDWAKTALKASQFLNAKDKEALHLAQIGTMYMFMGKPEEAISYQKDSLDLIERLNIEALEQSKIAIIGNLGIAHMNMGKVGEGIKFFEKHLALAKSIGNKSLIAFPLGNLGIAYTKIGKSKIAIEYLNQYLEICLELNDLQGKSYALNSLGTAYLTIGKADKAINYYDQSLLIKRQLRDYFGIANSLLNLGLAYVDLEQPDDAIERLEEALKIVEGTEIHKDPRTKGKIIGQLAEAYSQKKNFEKALKFHQEELKIAIEVKDEMSMAAAYKGLGYTFLNLNKLTDSEFHLKRALLFSRNTNDAHNEGAALFGISQILSKRNEIQQALVYAKQSLEIFERISSRYASRVIEAIKEWEKM